MNGAALSESPAFRAFASATSSPALEPLVAAKRIAVMAIIHLIPVLGDSVGLMLSQHFEGMQPSDNLLRHGSGAFFGRGNQFLFDRLEELLESSGVVAE